MTISIINSNFSSILLKKSSSKFLSNCYYLTRRLIFITSRYIIFYRVHTSTYLTVTILTKFYSLQPRAESQSLLQKENMSLCHRTRSRIPTLDITIKKKARKSNTTKNQFQKPMGVLSKFNP